MAAQNGGWSGWRSFTVSAIENTAAGKAFTLSPQDQQAVTGAAAGQFISVKVQVPNQELQQPQQFKFHSAQSNDQFVIEAAPEQNGTEFSVANILLNHVQIGDAVQVSAPQ